jgi:hypothetical protein
MADPLKGVFNRRGNGMALDGSILGNCASEQMEALEQAYGDQDVHVGAVMSIVEILSPQGTDEQGSERFSSNIRIRHNVGDPYRVIGLMQQAMQNILAE